MKAKEQKLIIENMLSSANIFSRCSGIIRPEFFEPSYRSAVLFIQEYFDKYHALPDFDLVNSKFDADYKLQQITTDKYKYTCDAIELFCKQAALSRAVLDSIEYIDRGEFGKMSELIAEAQLISLQKDMGVEVFHDPEASLLSFVDTEIYYPTMIRVLDNYLDGGLARKQLTLFSANSGVGKSNIMANIGANYARSGLNVVYISLELPEAMIYRRLASMLSGFPMKTWKENIPQIAGKLIEQRSAGAGTFRVKRLPTGSTANDIRSYLKQYELEFKCKPDVLIVDYVDIMSPNGGGKNLGISEQDKLKSEQLYEIVNEYDVIGLTASQQNREAIRMSTPDQAVIAGGLTKVNTVDNYISLFADAVMKAKGELFLHFLKTRSSDGVGKSAMLAFNTSNLQITDPSGGQPNFEHLLKNRKKHVEDLTAIGIITEPIDGLPGIEDQDRPSKAEEYINRVNEEPHTPKKKLTRAEKEADGDGSLEMLITENIFRADTPIKVQKTIQRKTKAITNPLQGLGTPEELMACLSSD